MNRTTALAGLVAGLAFAASASAEIVVNLGTVAQVAPRPTIVYTGNWGSAVSSYVDSAGLRTITAFDIHAISQALGGNLALVEVRVRDTGSNSYGTWSPGADIDLFRVVGANLSVGTVGYGYQGNVTQHQGETQDVLKTRVDNCDAVSGDQHFNSQHFVSLGQGGMGWIHFADFVQGSGGVAGGDGPGGWGGGQTGGGGGESGGESGGSGGGGSYVGGIIVQAGLKLEIGEAGFGESYGAELVFEQVTVPAPGGIAILAGAGLLRRRRR
jgi:hypothetical protein